MSVNFKESETKKNLMRAFAGESMARNRYTFAAAEAREQGLHVIDAVFTFTANQEKEHGEIFYNFLTELNGEKVDIDGSFPVNITSSVTELLEQARGNEFEEFDTVYKDFAAKAKEEGFAKVAAVFNMIAEIEKTHGNRFGMLYEMLKTDKLFVSDAECGWMCLNCGHIHNGTSAPEKCPVCEHEKGFFIRLELAPFTSK